MTDIDKGVRKALLLVFRSAIFPGLSQDVMRHLLPIIMAHLSSTMTHLSTAVRITGIHFLSLLLQHYPMLLVSSFKIQVLRHYFDYLGKGPSSNGEGTGMVLLTLQSLVKFLFHLQSDTSSNQRSNKLVHRWLQKYDLHSQVPGEAVEALHGYKSNLFEPISCYTTQQKESMDEPIIERATDYIKADEFEEILEGLVSKLLDCWKGLMPEVLSTPNPDSMCLSCMIAITKALTYVFQSSARDAEVASHGQERGHKALVNPSLVDSWKIFLSLRRKILPLLLQRLMQVFPVEAPPIHHQKVEEGLIALNVGICEAMMNFLVPETLQSDVDGCKPAFDSVLNYYVHYLHGLMLPSSQLSMTVADDRVWEPHLKVLLPFIPRLLPIVPLEWRDRLLQAFTRVLNASHAKSGTKLVCLSTMTKILLESKAGEVLVPLEYQQLWLESLPKVLWELKHTHPASSKVVLQMLLHLGRSAGNESILFDKFSSLQPALIPFLCTTLPSKQKEEVCMYGPFVKLPQDCQELAVDSWWYFGGFSLPFLKAVAKCCLCLEVSVHTVVRIIEVVRSKFSRGCVELQHYLSFLFTVLVGSSVQANDHEKKDSNGNTDAFNTLLIDKRRRHNVICRVICEGFADTGDGDIVLQLLGPCLCEHLLKYKTQEMLIATMRVVATLRVRYGRNKKSMMPQPLVNALSESTLQELLISKMDEEESKILLRCCITLLFKFQNYPQCLFKTLQSRLQSGSPKGSEVHAISRLLLEILKQEGASCHLFELKSMIQSITQALEVKVNDLSEGDSANQLELKELVHQVHTTSSVLFGQQLEKPSEVE